MHRVSRGAFLFGGFVLVSAALASAERPGGPNRFAIQGARVFTGSGSAMEGATVVVDGGLVTAVGTGVEIPAGAWVVEAAGKTVYPGFVDALGTLGLPAKKNGEGDGGERVPFASGPEDRPATTTWRTGADELDPSDARIASWRDAGFTTAVIAPSEGIFPGQASVVDLAGERAGELVVATPVAMRVNLTPPGSGRSFPGSLMGVIAYVKQCFLDARHYRESWAAYDAEPQGRKRPAYDRALEPLARVQADGGPVLFPAVRRHEILRVLELAKEGSVRPIVYGAHEGYAAAEALRDAGAPVIVSLDWPKRDEKADPEEEEPLRVLRMRENAPTTPAALEKAGVRFAFTADGIAEPAKALAAVREAIARGLTEEGAVRALTLSAAEIYGVDDRMGSLEPGKIANLVIASGDIFSAGTRVETVFVEGVKFDVLSKEGETK